MAKESKILPHTLCASAHTNRGLPARHPSRVLRCPLGAGSLWVGWAGQHSKQTATQQLLQRNPPRRERSRAWFLAEQRTGTCAGTVTKQTVLDKTRDIQAFQAKQCRSVGNVIMASTSEEDMSGWAQRLRAGHSHELCRPLPRFMSARQLAAFPFGGSHDGAP